MIAIISDIHANLEALEAVVADIERHGVADVVCLGDIVGYGPDPIECLRRSMAWAVVVAGEFDRTLVEHDPDQWSEWVNGHIRWMQQRVYDSPDAELLFSTVRSFRERHDQLGCQFCHGMPSDARKFVFPEDIYDIRKMDRCAQEFDHVLFTGHSHIPGLFALTLATGWEYIEVSPGDEYDVGDYAKLICSVGSVGQPRDGDERASFVLFDGCKIQFHRVEYDIAATIAKIKNDPDIDDMHGDRLPEGR